MISIKFVDKMGDDFRVFEAAKVVEDYKQQYRLVGDII